MEKSKLNIERKFTKGSSGFPLSDAINLLDNMSEINVFLCGWMINELSGEVRTELIEAQSRLIKGAVENIERYIKSRG